MASIATLEAPEFSKNSPERAQAPPKRQVSSSLGRRPPSTGWFLFVVFAVAYTGLGIVTMLVFNYHNGDALGRTANASYVLYSRYPHLAAVGFVWNPLPSLVQIPILLFRPLWPALQTKALSGAFMSALFMAGAVFQIRNILRDRGLSAPWIWGLTAAFAFNPMVLLYAANGQSEAPYLFLTIWAVHRLMEWLDSDRVADLIVAGVALGLDFLARYETVAIAIAAGVLVCIVTFSRSKTDERRLAFRLGLLDGSIVMLPFILSFVGWALVGWIITGSAFSQFSSTYGNSSQLSVDQGKATGSLTSSISLVVGHVLLTEALLPVAIIIALYLAIRRRDMAFMPALFLFGGGLGFVAISYLAGSTIANLRYFSLGVPLLIITVAMIPMLKTTKLSVAGLIAAPERQVVKNSWWARGGYAFLVIILVVPAFPILFSSMQSPVTDPSDYGVRSIFNPTAYPESRSVDVMALKYGETVSAYVDSLNLPDGSVLVDTWEGFSIVMTADRMKTFIITSDLDFTAALNDPVRLGVRYFLVPIPSGVGSLDAVNRRYPTFWNTGAGFATLVITFQPLVAGLPAWRLYKIATTTRTGASS